MAVQKSGFTVPLNRSSAVGMKERRKRAILD